MHDGRAPIRVLVADDQDLVRAGFAALLSAEDGIEVVAQAGDGRAAVDQARARRVDVVLMDVRMPGADGIEATRRITAEVDPPPAVIMLTTFDLDEYVYGALRAGAAGFLLKDTPAAELVRAVRVVAAGDALLAPSVTRRLIADLAARGGGREVPGLDELTAREREVLTLVGGGLDNREIADRLVVGLATVKTHVNRLMAKLRAHSRAQLVVAAYESGLVRPGGS